MGVRVRNPSAAPVLPPSEELLALTLESERAAVFAIGLAHLRNREDAQDLVQEVMLRTARSWATVAELERPGAWIRRIALNLVADGHRERKRKQRLLAKLIGTRSDSRSEPSIPDAALWEAVSALPRRQREATVLYYVLDMSTPDIADTLEIAEGTVRATLDHARASLRVQLEGGQQSE